MSETYTNNFLQNNGFIFSLTRIPQTTFRCTEIDIPSLSVSPAEAAYSPGMQYFPGSANEFGELSVTFLVDENLANYEELYRWITQQRFGENLKPKNETEKLLVSDGAVMTMTNSSNSNRTFYFKDLFPTSLGGIHFDTTVTQPEPVICQVSFRFSYFELR
jgi:hypothetical protein